jgi:putative membrane protein
MDGDEPARDRDPDVRFLLANERTLLAWIRTGVAVQAGGVAVHQLASALELRQAVGLVLLSLGVACHLVGWQRFRAADRAIRRNQLPKAGIAPDAVVLAAVLVSAAIGAAMIT